MRNIIFTALFGILLGIYEATTATFFLGIGAYVLPILPCIVMLIVRERTTQALVLAGVSGIVLDVLASEYSTFASGRLLLIALLMMVVARSVLTNQSLYTAMVLTCIARVVDRLWIVVARWFYGPLSFFSTGESVWRSGWKIILADALLVGVTFIIITVVIQRFLVRRSSSNRRYV